MRFVSSFSLLLHADPLAGALPSPWNIIGLVISALLTLGILVGLFVTSRQLAYRALLKRDAMERLNAAYKDDVQSLSYDVEERVMLATEPPTQLHDAPPKPSVEARLTDALTADEDVLDEAPKPRKTTTKKPETSDLAETST